MKRSWRVGFVSLAAFLAWLPVSGALGVDRGGEQAVVEPPLGPEAAEDRGAGEFVEPRPGDPQGHPLGGWYLGVYGNYTPTGMVLTQVYPRTAAARAGLEIGDRIVAVNGRQIGLVLNRRIALDVALQSSRTGWVRLLVQDRRTDQLINIDVRLTRGRVHT